MKINHRTIIAMACSTMIAALFSTACQTTSIKTTWKSPDLKSGPFQKLALVAVTEKGLVRGGFENRFANQLAKGGQPAFATYQTLPLPTIKADKEAAAVTLRQAGADCILILRLVDNTAYTAEVRESRPASLPLSTGSPGDLWFDWFSGAFSDLSGTRQHTLQAVVLDTTLFDLNTGKRVWSCLTDTMVKEDVDRLELADAFVAKVVAALRKDGLVR